MSFNPPQFPTADQTYRYGNIIWRFDGTAGVWNILDGNLVGERGPQGEPGPKGDSGPTGNTGSPSTGDNASIIVSNGFITARLASESLTGVASFNPNFFRVSATGHVGLTGTVRFPSQASIYAPGNSVLFLGAENDTYIQIDGGNDSFNYVANSNILGRMNSVEGLTFGGVTAWFGNIYGTNLSVGAVSASNIVNSLNGLTGARTLTGDSGAIIGAANNTITARLATSGATGVASFPASFFSVSNGAVSLSGAYGVIGVTGIGVGNSDPGVTGRVTLTASGSITLSRSGNLITIGGGGGGAAAGITASPQQVLFSSGNGGTGSDNFVFNGLAATFGGANTQFTITGPTFNIGNNTVVRGGIFYDAAESAPYTNFGASQIQIRGASGSVQRFAINPSTSYTVSVDDSGGWVSTPGVAESVVVIMQSANGRTGAFNSDILTQAPTPLLGGTTGGIDVFTVMRIAYSGGSIKMAFPIARGMSGTNPSFNIGT